MKRDSCLRRRVERLRKLVVVQGGDLDAFEATAYFRKHFVGNKEFAESTRPLVSAELVNGITSCLAKALKSMGHKHTEGVSVNNPDMEIALLELRESDFIHGYLGTEVLKAVVLYFARDGVGLFSLSLQAGESGIVGFSIPNLQDLGQSLVDVKLRFGLPPL